MEKYEVMYIIRPTLEEEATKALIEDIEKTLTKSGGTVVKTDEWGLRELAYEIEKHTKGYYVLLNIEASPEALEEFNRTIRLREDIIRHLLIKEDH